MEPIYIAAFFGSLLGGFVGGMGMTLPRLVREVWRHGFDNHFCNVKGCCR